MQLRAPLTEISLQNWRSVLPRRDGLLVETFPRTGRWFLVASASFFALSLGLSLLGLSGAQRSGLAGFDRTTAVGDDAINAATQLTGHFPDSQDQRNTVRTRVRYELTSRVWLAAGAEYGSGLPFDFAGTYQEALAEYGQAVIDRINFERGRVRPSLAVGVSGGADLYKSDRFSTRLQADMQNLNNRLNVIDFGGLFSGNAIAPPRSYSLRLQTSF